MEYGFDGRVCRTDSRVNVINIPGCKQVMFLDEEFFACILEDGIAMVNASKSSIRRPVISHIKVNTRSKRLYCLRSKETKVIVHVGKSIHVQEINSVKLNNIMNIENYRGKIIRSNTSTLCVFTINKCLWFNVNDTKVKNIELKEEIVDICVSDKYIYVLLYSEIDGKTKINSYRTIDASLKTTVDIIDERDMEWKRIWVDKNHITTNVIIGGWVIKNEQRVKYSLAIKCPGNSVKHIWDNDSLPDAFNVRDLELNTQNKSLLLVKDNGFFLLKYRLMNGPSSPVFKLIYHVNTRDIMDQHRKIAFRHLPFMDDRMNNIAFINDENITIYNLKECVECNYEELKLNWRLSETEFENIEELKTIGIENTLKFLHAESAIRFSVEIEDRTIKSTRKRLNSEIYRTNELLFDRYDFLKKEELFLFQGRCKTLELCVFFERIITERDIFLTIRCGRYIVSMVKLRFKTEDNKTTFVLDLKEPNVNIVIWKESMMGFVLNTLSRFCYDDNVTPARKGLLIVNIPTKYVSAFKKNDLNVEENRTYLSGEPIINWFEEETIDEVSPKEKKILRVDNKLYFNSLSTFLYENDVVNFSALMEECDRDNIKGETLDDIMSLLSSVLGISDLRTNFHSFLKSFILADMTKKNNYLLKQWTSVRTYNSNGTLTPLISDNNNQNLRLEYLKSVNAEFKTFFEMESKRTLDLSLHLDIVKTIHMSQENIMKRFSKIVMNDYLLYLLQAFLCVRFMMIECSIEEGKHQVKLKKLELIENEKKKLWSFNSSKKYYEDIADIGIERNTPLIYFYKYDRDIPHYHILQYWNEREKKSCQVFSEDCLDRMMKKQSYDIIPSARESKQKRSIT